MWAGGDRRADAGITPLEFGQVGEGPPMFRDTLNLIDQLSRASPELRQKAIDLIFSLARLEEIQEQASARKAAAETMYPKNANRLGLFEVLSRYTQG